LTIDVIVTNPPQFVPITNNNPNVCEGEEVQLLPQPIQGATYTWILPNGSNVQTQNFIIPSVTLADAGTYGLIVGIGSCLSDTSYASFVVNPSPTVFAGQDTTIEAGQVLALQATSGGVSNLAYRWSPPDFIDNPFSSNIEFLTFIQDTFELVVTATNSNLCEAYDTLIITVIEPTVGEDVNLEITEVFTPNGDGVNDEWIVGNMANLRNYRLQVFDRRGIVVYTTDQYENDWQGTYNGSPLPEGTYWYIIRTDQRSYSGAITIIR
jgi:gliding motility-associated-like protein